MKNKEVLEKLNLIPKKNFTVFKYDEMEKIKNLVDDLGWEHQRMSSSGQETYEKLTAMLGWEFES